MKSSNSHEVVLTKTPQEIIDIDPRKVRKPEQLSKYKEFLTTLKEFTEITNYISVCRLCAEYQVSNNNNLLLKQLGIVQTVQKDDAKKLIWAYKGEIDDLFTKAILAEFTFMRRYHKQLGSLEGYEPKLFKAINRPVTQSNNETFPKAEKIDPKSNFKQKTATKSKEPNQIPIANKESRLEVLKMSYQISLFWGLIKIKINPNDV